MLFHVYKVFAYYGSLALFGAAGLAFNAFCLAAAPLLAPARRERFFQRAIQREFAAFTRWLRVARLVQLEYRGADRLATPGSVVVANHPGLLDAVFLLARVPAALCIFKPSVRRSPMLGAAAVRAGYLASDRGIGLVRDAATKLAAGATLVVFPEGTRTPAGGAPGRFKPGFALIARCAGAPVQLVRITCSSDLLTKERAWWKLPQLPARVVVHAGPRIDAAGAASTEALVEQVEGWFRTALPAERERASEPLATSHSLPTLTAS